VLRYYCSFCRNKFSKFYTLFCYILHMHWLPTLQNDFWNLWILIWLKLKADFELFSVCTVVNTKFILKSPSCMHSTSSLRALPGTPCTMATGCVTVPVPVPVRTAGTKRIKISNMKLRRHVNWREHYVVHHNQITKKRRQCLPYFTLPPELKCIQTSRLIIWVTANLKTI
jgi:hypothetical protein